MSNNWKESAFRERLKVYIEYSGTFTEAQAVERIAKAWMVKPATVYSTLSGQTFLTVERLIQLCNALEDYAPITWIVNQCDGCHMSHADGAVVLNGDIDDELEGALSVISQAFQARRDALADGDMDVEEADGLHEYARKMRDYADAIDEELRTMIHLSAHERGTKHYKHTNHTVSMRG